MPVRRVGTHRLECQMCDGHGYYTIVQLEQRGLPRCGWCEDGSLLYPAKLDLALELGVDHPALADVEADGYNRERSQVRALGGYQRAFPGGLARDAGAAWPRRVDVHLRGLQHLRAEPARGR